MGKFATIKAGALTTTDSLVSISPGVSLVLGGPSVGLNDAVTKNELDSLQATVNDMLNGSVDAYNSFSEIKKFVDDCTALGVTSLTNAVADEASARQTAVADEASARQTAVADEASARQTAVITLNLNIFKPFKVPLSTAVVPDESPPMVMSKATLNMCSTDGWYFKNLGPSSAARKINWYNSAPLNSNGVATYKSLLEVGILVKLLSRQSPPFLTIYTKLKASGNSASWYNAKYTFICNNSVFTDMPVNEGNFLFAVGVNQTSVGNFSGFRKVELTKDDYSSRGSIERDDEILAVSIGSDSSAAPGKVEFVLHNLIFLSENGNYSHSFSNADVLQKFLLIKMDEVFGSLGQNLPSSEIGW